METVIELAKVKNLFSYEDYKKFVIECSEKNATTGNEQLPERIEATKINAQRMKRIDKQIELNVKTISMIINFNEKWKWIVLAESWCGDGAQNIPLIAKIAKHTPNIELKIILRDENPEIMNMYLTNGSKSIPKLICINSKTTEEIGTWGPRPLKIQEMVKKYKTEHPYISHDEFVKTLHFWYAKDKGESLQKDFVQLLGKWGKTKE